ncbi:hypothetical protein D3C76_1269100 [compost metagenome]
MGGAEAQQGVNLFSGPCQQPGEILIPVFRQRRLNGFTLCLQRHQGFTCLPGRSQSGKKMLTGGDRSLERLLTVAIAGALEHVHAQRPRQQCYRHIRSSCQLGLNRERTLGRHGLHQCRGISVSRDLRRGIGDHVARVFARLSGLFLLVAILFSQPADPRLNLKITAIP